MDEVSHQFAMMRPTELPVVLAHLIQVTNIKRLITWCIEGRVRSCVTNSRELHAVLLVKDEEDFTDRHDIGIFGKHLQSSILVEVQESRKNLFVSLDQSEEVVFFDEVKQSLVFQPGKQFKSWNMERIDITSTTYLM